MGRVTGTFYRVYARAKRVETIVLTNLMFETIGSTTYRLALRRATHPAVRQMLTILTRDESFHVPLNVHFLREALAAQRPAIDAALRMQAHLPPALRRAPRLRRGEPPPRRGLRPASPSASSSTAYAEHLGRLFLHERDLALRAVRPRCSALFGLEPRRARRLGGSLRGEHRGRRAGRRPGARRRHRAVSVAGAHRAEGLTKHYGDGPARRAALDGVDARHRAEGELVAVLGPSGSGKSTLLGIVGGLDRDYEGTVERLRRGPADARRPRALAASAASGSASSSRPSTCSRTSPSSTTCSPPRSSPRDAAAPPRPRARGSSTASASATAPATRRRSSPAASASASPSPAPCSAGPRSCSATSPPATSTPRRARARSSSSASSTREGGLTVVAVTHEERLAARRDAHARAPRRGGSREARRAPARSSAAISAAPAARSSRAASASRRARRRSSSSSPSASACAPSCSARSSRSIRSSSSPRRRRIPASSACSSAAARPPASPRPTSAASRAVPGVAARLPQAPLRVPRRAARGGKEIFGYDVGTSELVGDGIDPALVRQGERGAATPSPTRSTTRAPPAPTTRPAPRRSTASARAARPRAAAPIRCRRSSAATSSRSSTRASRPRTACRRSASRSSPARRA